MLDLALPLTQSLAFERTCVRLGVQVRRISSSQGTCLVQSRKFPVLGAINLISRGPVMQAGADALAILDEARHTLSGPLIVNATADIKAVGGLRIARGANLAMLDLQRPDEMRRRLHQKWRNQLNKAERAGLSVRHDALDQGHHDWFLDAEAAQQKARSYRSYPTGFLRAFAASNPGAARLYSATLDGQAIAGMLVLQHGRMATYQAGVTTPEGRRACAHNLLLWTMMCDLHAAGTTCLDLGRSDLSEGLRRFKTGTGARIEALPGSYLSHPWLRWPGRMANRRMVPPRTIA